MKNKKLPTYKEIIEKMFKIEKKQNIQWFFQKNITGLTNIDTKEHLYLLEEYKDNSDFPVVYNQKKKEIKIFKITSKGGLELVAKAKKQY